MHFKKQALIIAHKGNKRNVGSVGIATLDFEGSNPDGPYAGLGFLLLSNALILCAYASAISM